MYGSDLLYLVVIASIQPTCFLFVLFYDNDLVGIIDRGKTFNETLEEGREETVAEYFGGSLASAKIDKLDVS